MQSEVAQHSLGAAQSQDYISRLLKSALEYYQAGHLKQAEHVCKQVLEMSPDHPDVLHLLGLLARREEKNDLAIEYISRAIKIYPAGLMYFNLGNVYRSQGRFDEAIDSFQKAISLIPNYAQAYNNMGLVMQLQGRLDEATDCFLKAVNIMPDRAEMYSNLGDVLHENGHWEAATESLQRAIVLKPDFANAHLNLGKILRKKGKFHDALSSCQRAYALDPDHVGVNVALACVYQDDGRFGLAREHIDHALSLDPYSAEALAVLPFLGKMTLDDKPWAEKALSLRDQKLRLREEMSLNYALGKYYDDTCQYGTAFDCYTRANQLKKQMVGVFDRAGFGDRIDSIVNASNAEVIQKRHDGSSLSRRPLFIVGMPRSGTSLTEQILASHRDIFGAGELHFWDLKAVGNSSLMQACLADTDLLRRIVNEYEEELGLHSATSLRVIDKMPGNFLNLGMIHTAFPDARIIHVRRNPIDTCLSIYFQDFSEQHPYANDLEDLACYYREYRRLMDHWRTVLPADIFIEVSYESIVEDQEYWSRELVKFIGLDWDEGCLNFHQTERTVGTFSNWQVRQRIYSTSKERWQNYRPFIGALLPLLE